MSETSGLCCFTGYTAKDANYTSVDSNFTQLLRARFGCKVADVVNALDARLDNLTAQNVIVNNSFLTPGGPLGIFSFLNNAVAYVLTTTNMWEVFSNASLPFTEVTSQDVSLSGAVATVAQPGFYKVTLNATVTSAGTIQLGWSINGADPTVAFASVGSPNVNSTSVIFLNAGDTIQLAVMGTAATSVTVSTARWALSDRGF
jgi:hypothetical protein